MRVLVTGIAGFTGLYLWRLLKEKKHEVVGLIQYPDHQSMFPEEGGPILVNGDLERIEDVQKICQEFSPELVFHLAGQTVGESNFKVYQETQRVNFLGTLNLLEAIRLNAPQAKVLLVGSSAEYRASQKSEDELICEDHYLYPVSAYGLSKLGQEILGYQYYRHFDLPVLTVRPFNLLGAGQNENFVCSSIAKQIAEMEMGLRQPVLEVGDLSPRRDFINVRDAVVTYWLAATRGKPGEAYNVCSGELHSIEEVVDVFKNLSQVRFHVQAKDDRKKKVQVKALRGDNRKLKALGWKPQIAFRESLAEILEYWREQLQSGDSYISQN